MGRIIPCIMENKSHVWNHQPVGFCILHLLPRFRDRSNHQILFRHLFKLFQYRILRPTRSGKIKTSKQCTVCTNELILSTILKVWKSSFIIIQFNYFHWRYGKGTIWEEPPSQLVSIVAFLTHTHSNHGAFKMPKLPKFLPFFGGTCIPFYPMISR